MKPKPLNSLQFPSGATVDFILAMFPADARDRFGRTLLHYAVIEERADLIEDLIARGVPRDAQDRDGHAALHLAAVRHHAGLIRALLANGVAIDVRDKWGKTPLGRAVYCWESDRDEGVTLLLEAGADPDLENNYGVSPRKLAWTIANYPVRKFFDPPPNCPPANQRRQ